MKVLMRTIAEIFRTSFFSSRFFVLCALITVLFIVSFFIDWLESVARSVLLVTLSLLLLDMYMLHRRRGIGAERSMHDRLSNGDDNDIEIRIENTYAFRTHLDVIDEVPFQFQQRKLSFKSELLSAQTKRITYTLRPTERGEYSFGALNVFASSPISLLQRKYVFAQNVVVPVYPSFIQMRKYELLAATNRLSEVGVKRIRRIGIAKEFDQIRDYVAGDEYRTINWNATARHSDLMVNQYQDEKAQSVYSLIDMGRAMKLPFEGLSLLDYAINASLVISNIAMMKDDKAGLMCFTERIEVVLKAERGRGQMKKILELLYNQKTNYREPNYEMLYATVRRNIHQRSLLLLFTNFETLSSLKRQLPYLTMLAKSHVLCVIFFENTELRSLLDSSPSKLEDIYIQTIAEKFALEKKLIVGELQKRGIHSILTAPSQLSVNTINKYLELKARGEV